MEDPHRNLLGALANMTSDRIKYYVVRLLGSKHHLWGLKNAAFPHAINNEPHNPF